MPGREAQYSLFTLGVLMPEIASLIPDASLGLLAALGHWSAGEVMLNLAGTGLSNRQVLECFPAGYQERLQAAKRAYDPGDMFRFGGALRL